MLNHAYLLLGSNIEPRLTWLEKAVELLTAEVKVLGLSGIYETAAWGMEEGTSAFLNRAIEVATGMAAAELLEFCIKCEKELGRVRTGKVTSRTIDIDILLYNDNIIKSAELTVPHPRLHLRRFALAPLEEIAGDVKHPVLNKTIKELLLGCEDESEVRRIML